MEAATRTRDTEMHFDAPSSDTQGVQLPLRAREDMHHNRIQSKNAQPCDDIIRAYSTTSS
jgi:hypothetical protein